MSGAPRADDSARQSASPAALPPRFMSVKQVAEYLHINEKKIYSLVREERIPATKATGKWVFPRELVDRWLLESSHGGLLVDRLIVAGSDDPLLAHLVTRLAQSAGPRALISYTPTGTRLGLGLLAALRVDVGCVHWGPDTQSRIRHPALLRQHAAHNNWILVRALRREQGLLVRPDLLHRYSDVASLLQADLRWAMRQDGAGSRQFLLELLAAHNYPEEQLHSSSSALSEREAAAQIVMDAADIAAGIRASATEFGLAFIPIGWEAFDFCLGRGVYFRTLFQNLLDALRAPETQIQAQKLGGYDLRCSGDLIWGMD